MERTVSVSGKSTRKLPPDLIEVSVTLRAKDPSYPRAMEESSRQLSALRGALEDAGVRKDRIRTSEFNVSAEYRSVRNKNGDYEQAFDGYGIRHRMTIRFPMDTELLSRVLGAVAECTADPELFVAFTLENEEAEEELLLADAVADARRKAEILCAAGGARVGRLMSLSSSSGGHAFRNEMAMDGMVTLSKVSMGRSMPEFSPEDVSASAQVSAVWEIVD